MKRIYLLGALSVVGVGNMSAEVTGVVRSSDAQPLQGASVVLLALPDSTYVNGALTDESGHFMVTGEEESRPYLLSVQAFGHEQQYIPFTAPTAKALDITLAMAATELNEVTVRGKAPSITREGGKFIFIPNDLADDVSSANKLMEYVPLVSWSDRKVSILGKGVSKVYLNGRDPHWDTTEIQAMLRSLDPHHIKRVEIITDPGATQSASYGGGVINIIYDDPSQGWRGNAYASANLDHISQSVFPNIWMNYQKGKFKSSVNLMYHYGHNLTKETRTYDFIQEGRKVVNELDNSSDSHTFLGKVNLSYDLTDKSILGVSLRAGGSDSHSTNRVNTTTTEEGKETRSTMSQTNEEPLKTPSFLGMLYYTLYTDAKGSMLDMFAAYGIQKNESNYRNDFSGLESIQDMTNDVDSYYYKADYTQVFNPKTRLSAGFVFSDAHIREDQKLDGDFRSFKYDERQIQGYLQFSRVWSNIFSSEVGLRLENTHTFGHQRVEDLRNTQDYTDLFPSVSLNFNIPSGSQSVSLSYQRNITRPNMYELDPYKLWSSDNSYTQGNPDLKPSYSDFISLYYRFLRDFIFSTSYAYDHRLMMHYTINTPDGYSMSSTTNSGRSHHLSMNMTYNKGLLPWWRTSATGGVTYRNIKSLAMEQRIKASEWGWNLSWSNTFFISRRHFLIGSIGQTMLSATNRGTYSEGLKYLVSVSLQKSFPFGLEVSVSGALPLVGYKDYQKFHTPEYSYEYRRNQTPYGASISLSYTFGKKRVQGAKDRTNEVK